MKRKLISNSYLKGVLKFKKYLYKDEELNTYVSLKNIIQIDKPLYIEHEGYSNCAMNDGYYVLEYIPMDLNYLVRVFINEKGEVVEWYIDVTLGNGVCDGEIYYDDLYLDILYFNDNIVLIDQDDLVDALDSRAISKEEYDFAHQTANMLIEELTKKTNVFVNRGNKDLHILLEKGEVND